MNMISKFRFAVVFALLMLIVGSNAGHVRVAAQNKNIRQFMIGVLRADGTLIPFAQYRHGVWWNPWPEATPPAANNEATPKSLGGHLEPWFQQCNKAGTSWYSLSSDDSPLVLKPLEAVQVENHSQTNWALMTNYPKKQNAEKYSHHKHIGMALNIDLKIEGMVETEKRSDEVDDVIAYVKSAFNSAEIDEITRIAATPAASDYLAESGFPSSSAQRAKVELSVTKLYRNKSSLEGRHIYYIEVEKEYQKPIDSKDSSCPNVAVLKGWVLKGKDGVPALLNDSFGLGDCDGKGRGSSVEWFSVMTLNNHTFLFAVEHGWEDESYTIYELKEFELVRVLETFGG